MIEADLRGDAEPWAHDLHLQPIWDVPLPNTVLPRFSRRKVRGLVGANLKDVRLDGANLRDLDLAEACFDGAVLINADLTRADLRGASFRGAFMNGANLTDAAMEGADLTAAVLGRTLLTRVDLSKVRGLHEVSHSGSSEIGLSTLIESSFQIPRKFLQAAGVSRGLLDDFDNGRRFPNTHQTCFLSYSSADSSFARLLYNALVVAGVRVFWDQMDILPGDALEERLAEAIREHDRFLVVLSDSSMESIWVRKELDLVWHSDPSALLPIRICPIQEIVAWIKSDSTIPTFDVHRVSDFTAWKDASEFERELDLVLRALKS